LQALLFPQRTIPSNNQPICENRPAMRSSRFMPSIEPSGHSSNPPKELKLQSAPPSSVGYRRNAIRTVIRTVSILGLAACLSTINPAPQCHGQIVQSPGMGTFNLSTSVAVPDRGTMNLGGNSTAASQSNSGFGNRGLGGVQGGSGVSVSTTVIDLDELDRMIRSQSAQKSNTPKLQQFDPRGFSRIPAAPRSSVIPPGYDYLATLSGHSGSQRHVTGYGSVQHEADADATKYYLTLAKQARQRGHWASVETYYRMAWQSLPANRREFALKSLQEARSQASEQRVLSKGQPINKPTNNQR